MTDDQLKQLIGVDETFQMLAAREHLKSMMSPEEWEQNMEVHKASVQKVVDELNLKSPMDAADLLVTLLETDTSVDPNHREVWKALVVIAAFEMQEF